MVEIQGTGQPIFVMIMITIIIIILQHKNVPHFLLRSYAPENIFLIQRTRTIEQMFRCFLVFEWHRGMFYTNIDYL